MRRLGRVGVYLYRWAEEGELRYATREMKNGVIFGGRPVCTCVWCAIDVSFCRAGSRKVSAPRVLVWMKGSLVGN